MWNDKKKDRAWLIRYTDLIWLGNWNYIMPWLWMILGASIGAGLFTLAFLFKFFVITFGMSVFWDMVFVKMEDDVWVRPIRVWSALPWWGPDRTYSRIFSVENKMLIIGFNSVSDMMLFNYIRIVVLAFSVLL
jgi:hypothetical protein